MRSTVADDWALRAWRADATDLHVDPEGDERVVRYRIAGRMQDAARLSRREGDALVRALCERAQVDPHRRSGRWLAELSGRDVVVRVTTLPTSDGAAASVRFAGEVVAGLADLGFGEHDLRLMQLIPFCTGIVAFEHDGPGTPPALEAVVRALSGLGARVVMVGDATSLAARSAGVLHVPTEAGLGLLEAARAALASDLDALVLPRSAHGPEERDFVAAVAGSGHLVLVAVEPDQGAALGGAVVTSHAFIWGEGLHPVSAGEPDAQRLLHPHASLFE